MIRKFMTTVALGSLFVGGLAASHLAFAQADAPQRRLDRVGPMAMADANKDGNLTRAELTQALTARFARMDSNGDGKVTKEERAAQRTARLDARFTSLDADKNGQISKAEFTAGHDRPDGKDGDQARRGDRRGGPDGGRHMRGPGGGRMGMMGGGMGGRADADKDGTLTREEFMAGPLAMFDKADANKDGTVTAAEQQAVRATMRDGWKARQAEAQK
ncbi:calcium-binding protein [Sphingobium aromaticiconvertens]|uniref:EF-hand domain-containing protein n=1 Tax=Sphingobium aromaticiconvertens TaxID=365341 RepID=UPI00301964AC